jgi:hypothetical protein
MTPEVFIAFRRSRATSSGCKQMFQRSHGGTPFLEKSIMRRLLMTASVALACATVAQPAVAQVSFGGQAAMITMLDDATDLNGTFGVGPRVEFSPPIPTPMISPYVIGGWQWRRVSAEGFDAVTEDGATVGVGVGLGMVPVFVEVSMEFNEEDPAFPDVDNDPVVIQAGVLVGG